MVLSTGVYMYGCNSVERDGGGIGHFMTLFGDIYEKMYEKQLFYMTDRTTTPRWA